MSYLSLSLSLSRRYAEEKGVRATSVDHYDREENIPQTWRVDIGVGTHPQRGVHTSQSNNTLGRFHELIIEKTSLPETNDLIK